MAGPWYVNYGDGLSTGYFKVPVWEANHVYAAGAIVRQVSPTAGNERCFRTALGGTSHATTEPTWILTVGAAQPADNTIADWLEVTGNPTYNWSAPFARLETVFAAGWGGYSAGSGDLVHVSNNHAQTQASTSITITFGGTASVPAPVICVSDLAAPPTALATSATFTTTGNGNITLEGYAYIYGITFNVGTGAGASSFTMNSAGAHNAITLDTCNLKLINTNAASQIVAGITTYSHLTKWINVSVQFGNVGQYITVRGTQFQWNGGSVLGTAPTHLFYTVAQVCEAIIDNVDLSAVGSGKYLANGDAAAATSPIYRFKNCKLNAATGIVEGTIASPGGPRVYLDNCDSGDPATNGYRLEEHRYQGSVKTDYATRLDANATFSLKFVSLTTGPSFYAPLENRLMTPAWYSTTGASKTVSVEILHDSLTALTDQDIWLEGTVFTTAGYPLGTIVSGRCGIFGTPAAWGAGTGEGNWTKTMTNPNSQVLTLTTGTLTVAGYIRVKVMLAKANYTVYVCPKVGIA